MAKTWTTDDMYELATRHARIETAGDLDGTMATLVDAPIYEFHPIGFTLTTTAPVRRYYEHLIGSFIPMTRGYELLEEWVNETSLAQEYSITLGTPEGDETHRVIGVLFVTAESMSGAQKLLAGERIYGSERCIRLMAGDALVDERLAR